MPADLVEDSGSASANCYCSQDEADEYLDDIYGADEWAQLDDDTKARLIITAAKQIDALDRDYESASDTQAMWFPVTGYTDDGYDKAKEANILQAFYLFQNNDAMVESRTGAMQGTVSESLGPTSRATVGFNQLRKLHPETLRLLAPYVSLGVFVRRG